MKKLLLILSSLIIIIVLNSCSLFYRTVNCPEFNKDNLNWLPYTQNDTVLFIDNNQKKYTLKVNQIWLDHQTAYSTENDCVECVDFWGIEMNDPIDSLTIGLDYNGNSNSVSETYSLIKGKNTISLNWSYTTINYMESIELNGHIFKEVKEVYLTSNPGVKFVLAKNYGILMVKNGDFELYNFATLPASSVEMKSFNYIESSCK